MKLYELLGKEIELTAIVDNSYKYKRFSGWDVYTPKNFKLITINETSPKILNEEIKKCDIFVDSLYYKKNGLIAETLANLYHKKSFMHADGGIAKDRGFIKNTGISFLIKRHNYFLSSSIFTDKYFNFYAHGKRKIYHYNFSSFTNNDVISNNEKSKQKEIYKEKLGIDKYTFLSVGRPIHRKGFDILLKAFKMSGLDDVANLLIVGGEPDEEIRNIYKELNLKNVKFIGQKTPEELNEYYAAADSFVLCTREDIWGLVINEAISFNLPFITSDNCVAGLHFNKCEGIGKIVKNEDIEGYKNALLDEFNKTNRPDYFEISKLYTIEETSKNMLAAFNDVYAKKH